MILWTIQSEEVLDILERDGVYTCDETLSDLMEYFEKDYRWMVEQMDNRGIEHPEGLNYPLWAWHTRNWKHKRPILREICADEKGKRLVCIEFEIDDDKVLLSDFDSWHFVLNKFWLDDSSDGEDWDEKQRWLDSLPVIERERIMVESWQKIFDITSRKSDWKPNGCYIQGTFWELRKDMIRKVKRFKARGCR